MKMRDPVKIPSNVMDAFTCTEDAIHTATGLAYALYDLATEHPGLNRSNPSGGAIIALAVTLHERMLELSELHHTEFSRLKQSGGA